MKDNKKTVVQRTVLLALIQEAAQQLNMHGYESMYIQENNIKEKQTQLGLTFVQIKEN